jgi:prephenate dehydrogenase
LKQGRLNIGLVGGDAIGVAIATALQEAGHLVVALPKDQDDSKDKLEHLFPTAKPLSNDDILAASDLVL